MKKIHRLIYGLLLLAMTFTTSATAQSIDTRPRYARAEKPTPVLNTPHFHSVFGGADGRSLALDDQGLIRAVEFIALPGTVFHVKNALNVNGALIYQVDTDEYPPQSTGLYLDSRFVSVSAKPIPAREKQLPSKKQILDTMVSHQGMRYVWGGNVSTGIPEMFQFYPPSQQLTIAEEEMWALYGLDCSGLLYEATNGITPRNTSDLVTFGKPVFIEGLSLEQIASQLQPLDLIVWKGHVIMVLDQNHTIESCLSCSAQGGVTIRNLRTALSEVMGKRKARNHYPTKTTPQEKPFVIRRWF